MIWFTGCTHFGHANIIKLASRPFTSVEEMNETLVERYNERVKDDDLVIHLGDFAWSDEDVWLSRLKGRKSFVVGNHDDRSVMNRLKNEGLIEKFIDYNELKITKTADGKSVKFVLFHYPIDDWNGRWSGSIHLHCHTHRRELKNASVPRVSESGLSVGEEPTGLPKNYPPELKCNRFNVGVDATDFAPISFEEIMKFSTKD